MGGEDVETISSYMKFGCKGRRGSCSWKGIGDGGNLKNKHGLTGVGRLQMRDLVQRREFILLGPYEGRR